MKNEPLFVTPFATIVLLARSFTPAALIPKAVALAAIGALSVRCTTSGASASRTALLIVRGGAGPEYV